MVYRDMAIDGGYQDTGMTLDEAAAWIEAAERAEYERWAAEQEARAEGERLAALREEE